jgi:hypothetical protein
MKGMNCDLQPTLIIDHSQLVSVLDCVRNIVLKWALQLEEEGVVGEGLSFGSKEKEAATSQSVTNINNYFQNISNSQIQQDTTNASQSLSLNQLDVKQIASLLSVFVELLPSLQMSPESESELKAEIATVKAQVESPKPKENILKQSLGSIKSILEKAGGSAAGQALIELGKVLF